MTTVYRYDDLTELEQFSLALRMDINAEGIDALRHMLQQGALLAIGIDQLQEERAFINH